MKNKKGFTLVEIIVVLVILAILAAIAVPAVLGYVDDAKEARELARMRESLITAQVTFTKSAAFGENTGSGATSESGSQNYYLSEKQSNDIQKYLDEKPYTLIYGIGDPNKYALGSNETSKVYCIIYQKDSKSKPWYYDGKKWSHRYLWNKNAAKPGIDASRAMYSDGTNNRMNGVKDSKGEDAYVATCYVYAYGKPCVSGGNYSGVWTNIKNMSE